MSTALNAGSDSHLVAASPCVVAARGSLKRASAVSLAVSGLAVAAGSPWHPNILDRPVDQVVRGFGGLHPPSCDRGGRGHPGAIRRSGPGRRPPRLPRLARSDKAHHRGRRCSDDRLARDDRGDRLSGAGRSRPDAACHRRPAAEVTTVHRGGRPSARVAGGSRTAGARCRQVQGLQPDAGGSALAQRPTVPGPRGTVLANRRRTIGRALRRHADLVGARCCGVPLSCPNQPPPECTTGGRVDIHRRCRLPYREAVVRSSRGKSPGRYGFRRRVRQPC